LALEKGKVAGWQKVRRSAASNATRYRDRQLRVSPSLGYSLRRGLLDEFQPVKVEFDIDPTPRYIALEKSLAQRVQRLAAERGVSVETVINLWVNGKASVHPHQ
jgi:hypothetical protein